MSRIHMRVCLSRRCAEHVFAAVGGLQHHPDAGVAGFSRLLSGSSISAEPDRILDRGQASHETHPQLLRADEVSPGIIGGEYAARRERVMDALPDGAVLLVPSSPVMRKAGVIPYPYRQSADFFYLTGCSQPGGVALLHKERQGSAPGVLFSMFMPQQSREVAAWDGHLAGPRDAEEFFGADQGRPFHELSKAVSDLIRDEKTIFFDSAGGAGPLLKALPALAETLSNGALRSPRSALHRQRWVKSPAEVALLRRSCDIVSEALVDTMAGSAAEAALGIQLSELQVGAALEFGCRRRGAQQMAFPSVVAAGPNACTVHYSRLDQPLRRGDLVLADVGCEHHGYTSDVTRVWSPWGAPGWSQAQRDVYEAVLGVALECIQLCQPGNTLRQVHNHSVQRLSEELVRLGVFPGADPARIAASGAYKLFYPTAVGHWLGLDTHDCDSVPQSQPLEPGVVLTVEPGLYLGRGWGAEVPRGLEGIGVRIEDDILITPSGPEVLSKQVPKTWEDIQELCSAAEGLQL